MVEKSWSRSRSSGKWFRNYHIKNDINVPASFVSSFSKFGSTGKTIHSTAEAISTSEGFKYPLTKTPRSCKYFLSSVTFMGCCSSALTFWPCETNVQTLGVCLHRKPRDTTRESWRSEGELTYFIIISLISVALLTSFWTQMIIKINGLLKKPFFNPVSHKQTTVLNPLY